MRILVVGGTGVLGRRTVPLLVAAGHDVRGVARRREAADALHAAGARAVELDVFDRAAAVAAASGHDAVLNLATSIPPVSAAVRLSAWQANDRLRRAASRVLAEAAIDAGARFVQESFAPTYRDNGETWIDEEHPLDPVAQTKTVVDAEASADRVTAQGGDAVVLRFGLFYDAGSGEVGRLLTSAAKGVLPLPGPGDRYSSMIYVPDAAAAVVAALTAPPGRYNVVEDEPMTRTDHAAVLADLLDRRRVRLLPAAAGQVPALRVLARSHRISNTKLREMTDWRPSAPDVRHGWRMVLAEQGPSEA